MRACIDYNRAFNMSEATATACAVDNEWLPCPTDEMEVKFNNEGFADIWLINNASLVQAIKIHCSAVEVFDTPADEANKFTVDVSMFGEFSETGMGSLSFRKENRRWDGFVAIGVLLFIVFVLVVGGVVHKR